MSIIKPGEKKPFETCPEFTGNAVCVDWTPPKLQKSKFGDKDVSRYVFEITEKRKDGSPFAVWSKGFALSLHEKAGLRKFLKGWRGHDLTAAEEAAGFDPELMVGKPAFIHVGHTKNEKGDTFANVDLCSPPSDKFPVIAPSGKFVRTKDRKDNSGYGRAESKPEVEGVMDIKVHVGSGLGQLFRGLPRESILKYITNWKPGAEKDPKANADDKRLIAALTEWQRLENETASDDVPMDY